MGIGDNLDPKHVCEARSAVIAEGAEYQVLSLLIEDQYAGKHLEFEVGGAGVGMWSLI